MLFESCCLSYTNPDNRCGDCRVVVGLMMRRLQHWAVSPVWSFLNLWGSSWYLCASVRWFFSVCLLGVLPACKEVTNGVSRCFSDTIILASILFIP